MPGELACWVALHAIKGVGPATFRRLMEHFGSAEKILFDVQESELLGLPRLSPAVARRILSAGRYIERAEQAVQRLAKRGIKLLRIGEECYPQGLLALRDPPPLLYVMGELRPADAKSVAIVGTTNASDKGRTVAKGFASRLCDAGCTVVSGYAHGIDSAAHRGAIAAGGRTIMVLPYGLERFEPRMGYPPIEKLVRNAAIVSECPPQARWSAESAICRNRMVAALSRALLVVETGMRGGTVNTIGAAHAQEVTVFVLRYSKPSPSAGGNELAIAKGGIPVERYSDIRIILDAVEAGLAKRAAKTAHDRVDRQQAQ